MQCKAKSENLAHISGYQIWAVTAVQPAYFKAYILAKNAYIHTWKIYSYMFTYTKRLHYKSCAKWWDKPTCEKKFQRSTECGEFDKILLKTFRTLVWNWQVIIGKNWNREQEWNLLINTHVFRVRTILKIEMKASQLTKYTLIFLANRSN